MGREHSSLKVLILANKDEGLFQFRAELIEKLARDGHKVFFCVPNGEFVSEIEKLGATFIACPFLSRRGTNPVDDLKLIRFYRKTLKEVQPDIVFTYTIKPNVYGGILCGRLGIPYLVNVTGLGTAVENEGPLQKLTLRLYKLGLKKSQVVFFQNEANRDFMLSKGVVAGRCELLPGSGVNLQRFQVLDYPEDDGTTRFFYFARVMREKGIEEYLEAAKQIRSKYPHTEFHVCGSCEDEYRGSLEACEKGGVVIYHGSVKDVREMHAVSSCTVHPTFYPEGMSNVLLESCACGRPIITTNRPGCREVVDDGVNGFVVKQRDAEDLISKIENFLALPYAEKREMGLNGRRKVERKFDRQIIVERYLKEMAAAEEAKEARR